MAQIDDRIVGEISVDIQEWFEHHTGEKISSESLQKIEEILLNENV